MALKLFTAARWGYDRRSAEWFAMHVAITGFPAIEHHNDESFVQEACGKHVVLTVGTDPKCMSAH